jgi:tetratricopeptide (TPR) repeat protein
MLLLMSELSSQELQTLKQMQSLLEDGSHYDLLGVSRDATPEEVKLCYYELSRRFHPDRYYRRKVDEQRGMIEAVFTGINRSYELLADEAARRTYDLDLQRHDVDRGDSESRTHRRERQHRARRRQEVSPVEAEITEESTDEVLEEETDPGAARRAGSQRVQELRARRARRAAAKERGQEVRSSRPRMSREEQPAAAPVSDAPRRTRRGMSKLKNRMADNIAKAQSYFEDGKSAFEQGQWIKAASSLHLAVEFDPSNQEYKDLSDEAQKKAKQSRAAQFIQQAESAEGFGGYREAIEHYKRAVACDPPDGLAFFRLGELLLKTADDARAALNHFRTAAAKEPENSRYGLALADLYMDLKMPKNAEREFSRVLEREPKNAIARAGHRRSRR